MEKVKFRLEENLEGLSGMVVLLYAFVVVSDCTICESILMVGVVQAIVVVVVAGCCNERCDAGKMR